MARTATKAPSRKPRTDAQRNRERLLDAAKDAFKREGVNASLDDIAKRAGVGAGTLYRHFPTRDALVEGVYRSEVERLSIAARTLAEHEAPLDALRAWMLLWVDHVAAKRIIAPALNSLAGGPSKVFETTRDQVRGAMEGLVKRAVKSGDLRKDVDPFDLLRALIGAAHVDAGSDWRPFATRLVDILIAGARRR